MKSRILFAVVALAGCLSAAQDARADLLAYEGFSYGAGDVTASGVLNGGTGWASGGWQIVYDGSGSTGIVSGSLAPSSSSLTTAGNSMQVYYGRFGRFLDTSATGAFANYLDGSGNIGKDGTSLYMSFVMKAPVGQYYEMEFKKDSLEDAGRIGGIGNNVDSAANSYLRSNAGATSTSIAPTTTNPMLYVVKFDFLSGNNDTVSVYVNPTLGTMPGTATLVKTGAGDMSFDGMTLASFQGNSITTNFDEIRFGTTYASVTPTQTPEPGTIALLAMGLLSLLAYAWRKRK
jgi:hypothetical protein